MALSATIVQVNLTITNKTFQKTLYNQTSNDYMDITRGLTFEVNHIIYVNSQIANLGSTKVRK
jgi:hypothetical protein